MKGIGWGLVGLMLVAGCAGKKPQEVADSGRIAIAVTENGFEPKTVTVPAGKPVTLVVTRRTDKTCATDLVMPAEHIDKPLPLGQAVEITFTPDKPGELTYSCKMEMYKGTVIVK
jgi:plastocyanin domain-containing protein